MKVQVKAHTRHTKSGRTVTIRAHERGPRSGKKHQSSSTKGAGGEYSYIKDGVKFTFADQTADYNYAGEMQRSPNVNPDPSKVKKLTPEEAKMWKEYEESRRNGGARVKERPRESKISKEDMQDRVARKAEALTHRRRFGIPKVRKSLVKSLDSFMKKYSKSGKGFKKYL